MPSVAEVKTLVFQYMPAGAAKWYALASGAYGSMWTALARGFKTYGYDVLETLRRELRAQTMVERIPDWEAAIGIASTKIARYGLVTTRRAAIIARRREFGSSSIPKITAALAAVCGPAVGAFQILEVSRQALTSANFTTFAGTPITLANSADTDVSFTLADNAPASTAGVFLTLKLTANDATLIVVTLIGPDLTAKTWTGAFGTGSPSGQLFTLFAPEFAGKQITGAWALEITNNDGVDGTLGTESGILVEGIGLSAGGAEGLGASIFEWAVLVDESLITPATYDRSIVQSIVQRWNPAHCRGYTVIKNSSGGASGIWGDPTNSLWDGFTWE